MSLCSLSTKPPLATQHKRCASRNLDVVAQSFWGEHKLDSAAKLVGDEITNKVGAVTGITWRFCGWPAALSPFNDEACVDNEIKSRHWHSAKSMRHAVEVDYHDFRCELMRELARASEAA
jgi:hypothetical protein